MADRLAISFWIWGLYNTAPNGFFDDMEGRVVELRERGFNCIRLDAGTGLCHDRQGRRRGALQFLDALPGGHARLIRQMERFTAGRCDPLRRLLELAALAQRYRVKLILSSWYYLHTFWFTDATLTTELLGLPSSERFDCFARALDCLLRELEDRGLSDVVAFAEIFNEADGLDFAGGYGERTLAPAEAAACRAWHEEALAFLRERHPATRFAWDTCTPFTNPELAPRNAQVWNFHSYYLWSVYDVLEREVAWDAGEEPAVSAAVRPFLRPDPVPYRQLKECRGDRPPLIEDWYRRIWLYRNLDPAALPGVELLLRDNLARQVGDFKQRAADAVAQAVRLRDRLLPGVPLVLGEGASYCADARLRWEERADAYWEVVEHAARACRNAGLWGAVPRTNSGPEDPAWHEYPDRLRRVNEIFLADAPPAAEQSALECRRS